MAKKEHFDAQKAQVEELIKRVQDKCLNEQLDPWKWYLVGHAVAPQNAITGRIYKGCNAFVCGMLGASRLISEKQLDELCDKLAGWNPKMDDYYKRTKAGNIITDKKSGEPEVDWKKYFFDRRMAFKAYKDNGGTLPRRKLYPTLDENGQQVMENGKPKMHYADRIPIVYCGSDTKKDDDGEIKYDDNGREEKYWFARLYWLIDCNEIENYDFSDGTEGQERDSFVDHIGAEGVFGNYTSANKIEVLHKDTYTASCYMPSTDIVTMSKKTLYISEGAYYQVLAHECGHSTGAKNRLNRIGITNCKGAFGSAVDQYAEEELVAEFCSIFCQQALGIEGQFNNDVAYIKSWWEHMKNDPKKFARAANAGYRAFEYIFSFSKAEGKEEVA